MSTTAEDTLKAKSKENSIISGGHLVAKALKNEGADTLFMLPGGYIIDIYDGCVSEDIHIGGQGSVTQHIQASLYTGAGFSIAAKAVYPNNEAIAKTGFMQCQFWVDPQECASGTRHKRDMSNA